MIKGLTVVCAKLSWINLTSDNIHSLGSIREKVITLRVLLLMVVKGFYRRKEILPLLEKRYPGLPIQLCQFHQAQIVRRYTTNNLKTECSQALKSLMNFLTETEYEVFASMLLSLRKQYHDFLLERNEQKQFKHRRLKSAFRSLKSNLPYLTFLRINNILN